MKVIRSPHIISGFIYEEPLATLPALTHCGEALCARGHFLPAHHHPGFEFLYLSRGTMRWQIGSRKFTQQMGELFVIHPGEQHRTDSPNDSESQHLWVGLELEALGATGRRLAVTLRQRQDRILTDCQEVESVLRGLVTQVVGLRANRRPVILAYLQTFLAVVEQRLVAERTAAPSMETRVWRLPYSYPVQKAISYMQQHLDRRVPLREITALATARNVPHFCSQFHREVGMPPAAFQLQLRLTAARAALRQPAFSITLAAQQFGFSSSQHFSTLFRRTFGTTPDAWKRSTQARVPGGADRHLDRFIPSGG